MVLIGSDKILCKVSLHTINTINNRTGTSKGKRLIAISNSLGGSNCKKIRRVTI
jgi:hypothetical protein